MELRMSIVLEPEAPEIYLWSSYVLCPELWSPNTLKSMIMIITNSFPIARFH